MPAVNAFDTSQQAMTYLQNRFGTAFWDQYEYLRFPFYSYQQYLLAGAVLFTFFSQTVAGSVTLAQTNMTTAGNFQGGYYFLVQSIACKVKTQTNDLTAWDGDDASVLVSDFFNGFVQAGVLTWTINSFQYLQLPTPFLYCPPGQGDVNGYVMGNEATLVSPPPWCTLNNRRQGLQLTRPVLIEPGQTFTFQIGYPSGAVPVIATDIVSDDRNPLYIGLEIDGLLFRPVSS